VVQPFSVHSGAIIHRPMAAVSKNVPSISQGKAETCLRCDDELIINLLPTPKVKKTLNISQHLTKLRERIYELACCFYSHGLLAEISAPRCMYTRSCSV